MTIWLKMLCLACFASLSLTFCLAAGVKRQVVVISDLSGLADQAIALNSAMDAFPTSGGVEGVESALASCTFTY